MFISSSFSDVFSNKYKSSFVSKFFGNSKVFIEFSKISLVNLFCFVILKNCFDCDIIKFNFSNKSFSKNEFIFSPMAIFSFSDIFFITLI